MGNEVRFSLYTHVHVYLYTHVFLCIELNPRRSPVHISTPLFHTCFLRILSVG